MRAAMVVDAAASVARGAETVARKASLLVGASPPRAAKKPPPAVAVAAVPRKSSVEAALGSGKDHHAVKHSIIHAAIRGDALRFALLLTCWTVQLSIFVALALCFAVYGCRFSRLAVGDSRDLFYAWL